MIPPPHPNSLKAPPFYTYLYPADWILIILRRLWRPIPISMVTSMVKCGIQGTTPEVLNIKKKDSYCLR